MFDERGDLMETTLNIHTEILEKIHATAKSRGISCSAMIVLLLQKFMDESGHPVRMGRLVQYQRRGGPEDWHVFHVHVRADEYEYFLDLRKLFKLSVSLILAYAVRQFLEKQKSISITDNYPFRNYIMVKEYIGTIICWKSIWGYPYNIEKYIKC
jgi:hypothetical protein